MIGPLVSQSPITKESIVHHYGNTDYNVAASAAAARGREKMEEIIHRGQANAVAVVEQVQAQVPRDRIATAKSLSVQSDLENGFDLILPDGEEIPLHDHALGQVVEKAGPRIRGEGEGTGFNKYFSYLRNQGEFGARLAESNLNKLLAES